MTLKSTLRYSFVWMVSALLLLAQSDVMSNGDLLEGFLRYQAAVQNEVTVRNSLAVRTGDVLNEAMARQLGVAPGEVKTLQSHAAETVRRIDDLRTQAQAYASELRAAGQPLTASAFKKYDNARSAAIQAAALQIRADLTPNSWAALNTYLSVEYTKGLSKGAAPNAKSSK